MILVVDDSAAIRVLVKRALESAGFKVDECADGNQGLAKLLAPHQYSLVICDYSLPGMDGLTMMQMVKAKQGAFPFTVFFLTSESSESLKAAGKSLGVRAWIPKPFSPEKLIEAVKKVCEQNVAA